MGPFYCGHPWDSNTLTIALTTLECTLNLNIYPFTHWRRKDGHRGRNCNWLVKLRNLTLQLPMWLGGILEELQSVSKTNCLNKEQLVLSHIL